MTAISVRNASKRFGDTVAVDQVSFDVPYGAVTGFVGANGSGKTTTIRMIVGLVHPDSGEVLINGTRYADLENPRATVGAVIDRIGAHPGHTARQHLRTVAVASSIDTKEIDRCLEEVGLLDEANRPIGQFSMGMIQRCALAVALLASPRILILDEPANGLDPSGIRWLRDKIETWAAEGRAILVSSHQIAELAKIVDHLVVLHEGAVAYDGAIDDLVAPGSDLEDAVFELVS